MMNENERIEALRAERDRQQQVLVDAINKTITETGKTFAAPMLNAVAGALACTTAAMLCSVPPGKPRKALREAMEKAQRRAERTYDNAVPHAQIVNMGQLS